MYNELVVISGTAHKEMGELIAKNLNLNLLDVEATRFSDGEVQRHQADLSTEQHVVVEIDR